MAQLTDDCFAFDGPLITVADAVGRITSGIGPVVGRVRCPLTDALGRILSDDVVAPRPIPPHDNSAVDGYALYFDDLSPDAETVLPIGGRVAAGDPLPRPQNRGEAVQIFTGAPMPKGPDGQNPDTVMMLEDCILSPDGRRVTVKPGIAAGANRRSAGEDVDTGTTVLSAGTRLGPAEIGMLAACGLVDAPVYDRLSVALLSTGNEITDPGQSLPEGAVYDSNRFTIGAALRALGCRVHDYGILKDDPIAIRDVLADAAAHHPAILCSGGMSMGEEDHVRGAVESMGRLSFWRVAIKPGRPVGMGSIDRPDGERAAVIGLPGNPVAALTTFVTMAHPVLSALAGAAAKPFVRHKVALAFDYRKKSGRREFVRARLEGTDAVTGLPRAVKHGRSGAGVLSSLVGADGFVELPEDSTHLTAGTVGDFLSFAEVFR